MDSFVCNGVSLSGDNLYRQDQGRETKTATEELCRCGRRGVERLTAVTLKVSLFGCDTMLSGR